MGEQIGAFEAKTHFSQLLDRVMHGEHITITRRGKPVAELGPVSLATDFEVRRKALARVDAHRLRLRSTGVKVTLEDIHSAINEGRH